MVKLGRHRRLKISRLVRAGSSPARGTTYACLAQLVERLVANEQVAGSSPVARTKHLP